MILPLCFEEWLCLDMLSVFFQSGFVKMLTLTAALEIAAREAVQVVREPRILDGKVPRPLGD